MPTFNYKALDESGAFADGSLDARTRAEAYNLLLARKLKPVRIAGMEAGEGSGGADGAPTSLGRLNGKRLLLFTEELAELLEAGLQLEPALRIMETRKEGSALKAVAAHLRNLLREGKSFSSALRECPGSFSDLYINMMAAGETAGALPKILRRQAEYLAVVMDLQRRLVSALIYPMVVFLAGILLLVIFMTFLLPQLTSLLTRTGQSLPVVTRVLIGTSEFFASYWWAVLLGIAGLAGLHRLWVATAEGRANWDRVKLRLPLIGNLLKDRFLAQLMQTLATMVSNGVVLLNALTLARNATGNTYIRNILDMMVHQIGEGVSFSRAMQRSGFFPPVLMDIVAVGEQTGDIAAALRRAAEKYDKEFTLRMQRLTTLIQPMTILLVALFVGVVAYSMITGILTTVSGLRMR